MLIVIPLLARIHGDVVKTQRVSKTAELLKDQEKEKRDEYKVLLTGWFAARAINLPDSTIEKLLGD